jgi:hypothetical protein
MRISSLLLSSMCVAMLAACPGGGDDTGDETTVNPPGTTVDMTTMVDPTTGPVDPTPVDPTPPDPSTTTSTGPDDTSTGPDDTSTTDNTTGPPPGGLTCEAYCAVYETACVDFAEYDNVEACISQCKQWPVGEADDTDVNSLGCRTYHVGVASMVDPQEHCPHAGPNGAGQCVDKNAPSCEMYCPLYFMNCTDDLNLYTDMADCMEQCSHLYPGGFEDTANDSIGCRIYHAGNPAMMDDELHCPHAGPGGAGVCVPPA